LQLEFKIKMKTVKARPESKRNRSSVQRKCVANKSNLLNQSRAKKSSSLANDLVTLPKSQDLTVLFANIKKRFSLKHDPLSPKQWQDRPGPEVFAQSFDQLHRNTLLAEQAQLPPHVYSHGDTSYFYFHMFCLEKSQQLPASFVSHQTHFTSENRSK
jgi:hypothetical protein